MKTERSYHEPGDVVLAAWQEQVEQAKEKPWLASLLLRQGERILRRFVYFYQQLRSLPRNTRRLVQKRLATTLAGAALLLALSGTPSVHAADITVTPGSAGIVSDGSCSLVEAIINANNDAATHGDCTAGSGADVITLAGNTYSYTSDYGGNGNALPTITSQITIEADNATIQRTGGSDFRILEVDFLGDLTLNNATISGGNNTTGGGIQINYYSNVTINNSTLSNNSAVSGGAFYNSGGTVTINNSTISGNSVSNNGGAFESNSGFKYSSASVTVNDSTISGNTAGNAGGGIHLFHNNFYGKYYYSYGTNTLTFNRTIISGNSATNSGGEINNYGSTVYSNNNNLLGESTQTNAQAFVGFTPSGSDITATSDGTNPTALASILNTTLANNGTQPHTFTHALVSGSPAINVIPTTDASCNADGSSTDQRGGARANPTYNSGTACDIGAFEYGATASPTAITIEGLTARSDGKSAPAAIGATGVLALLTGGWLARIRRRRS